MSVPNILSIAGTDPTGGAGIHADLKSIAANGGYGMAAVTAVVAQNTRGVRSVHTPPISVLTDQLDAVADDVRIDAVKIGMLGDSATIDAVATWLDRVSPPVVVLDPVMVATSGDRLLRSDAEASLEALITRAACVTPNVPELAILAGGPPAEDEAELRRQACVVARRHGVRVLAKGGHLEGESVVDLLVDAGGDRVQRFTSARVHTGNTHGTGCSLSSALATLVARGLPWGDAVAAARAWLAESLRGAADLDVGDGNGPVHHLAGLWARGGLETRPSAAELRRDWWASITEPMREIDTSPFVQGLGDGTLPAAPFERYLAQDALYLGEYSRLLATASSLAPTAAEQAFWATGAAACIEAELQLHDRWLAGDRSATPDAANRAYLDHLRASVSGGYAVLAAALLPCYWIYQDVGARLVPLAHETHPYRDWLHTYGDESFAAATERAITIVTESAAAAEPALRARMHAAFVASAWHEHAFFASPLLPH